ncbi:MAG: hypothetical protein MJK04_00490 [Psychrosphaera sp.]|nr:hypothetical protein [Psychrosphaera sp.]
MFRNLTIVCLLIGLSGCKATVPRFSVSQPLEQNISLDNVFIYSFIGFFNKTLGYGFVAETRRQLHEALKARGVTIEHAWFERLNQLRDAPAIETAVTPTSPNILYESKTQIPVQRYIQDKAQQESQAGSKYRLIIYPSNIIKRLGFGYTFTLTVQDIATGKTLWEGAASNHHDNAVMGYDEFPQEKAKVLVKVIMNQLIAARMI